MVAHCCSSPYSLPFSCSRPFQLLMEAVAARVADGGCRFAPNLVVITEIIAIVRLDHTIANLHPIPPRLPLLLLLLSSSSSSMMDAPVSGAINQAVLIRRLDSIMDSDFVTASAMACSCAWEPFGIPLLR